MCLVRGTNMGVNRSSFYLHFIWRSRTTFQVCFVNSSMSDPTSAILASLEPLAAFAMFKTSKSRAIFLTRPLSIRDPTATKARNLESTSTFSSSASSRAADRT
ncbi:hypothetical protein V8G54_024988 [Vigna mungo]|uniref:Uncharacterized protein n=1 Tax=Vigna mungo TaxID=3915 RepID=A0AAQ3N787_VIGMU